MDHSPGFVPPPDFCPRGKSDKIRPQLGTKVCSALSKTGIQTTNTFLQESANIIFVKNILDFKAPSPYRALFGLFDLKSIGLRAEGTRAR